MMFRMKAPEIEDIEFVVVVVRYKSTALLVLFWSRFMDEDGELIMIYQF